MSKLNHPGSWHYVDYPPQYTGCFPVYDIRNENGTCIVTTYARFIKTIESATGLPIEEVLK